MTFALKVNGTYLLNAFFKTLMLIFFSMVLHLTTHHYFKYYAMVYILRNGTTSVIHFLLYLPTMKKSILNL